MESSSLVLYAAALLHLADAVNAHAAEHVLGQLFSILGGNTIAAKPVVLVAVFGFDPVPVRARAVAEVDADDAPRGKLVVAAFDQAGRHAITSPSSGTSRLIKCGDHKLAPWCIVCVHL